MKPSAMAMSPRCDERSTTASCHRAGALPTRTDIAYVRKIRAAGGFKRYEQNHLNAITATFVPKFPRLPPELVRRVVEYAFHVGDY